VSSSTAKSLSDQRAIWLCSETLIAYTASGFSFRVFVIANTAPLPPPPVSRLCEVCGVERGVGISERMFGSNIGGNALLLWRALLKACRSCVRPAAEGRWSRRRRGARSVPATPETRAVLERLCAGWCHVCCGDGRVEMTEPLLLWLGTDAGELQVWLQSREPRALRLADARAAPLCTSRQRERQRHGET